MVANQVLVAKEGETQADAFEARQGGFRAKVEVRVGIACCGACTGR